MVRTIKFIGQPTTQNALFDAVNFKGDYRIDDVDQQVHPLNEKSSVFFRLLDLFRRGPDVFQPKYQFWRDDIPQVSTKVTAAANSSATAISVEDATVFQQAMHICNLRTMEIMEIDRSTTQTTTGITITSATGRGKLGTAAAALAIGDELVAIGVPLGESGKATEINYSLPTSLWNYVSFFTTSVSVTDLQNVTKMRFGFDFTKQHEEAWYRLQRQVAFHMLLGRRGYVTDAVQGRQYFSDGVLAQTKSNYLDLTNTGGIISWPMMNQFLNNVFAATASSPSKTLVCGQALWQCITQAAYLKVMQPAFVPELNTMVQRIGTDQGGMVDVVLDKWTFPGSLSGCGTVLDMNHIQVRGMTGFPFQVKQNIQANDEHQRRDEIFGSTSVQVTHEECFGYIKGARSPF